MKDIVHVAGVARSCTPIVLADVVRDTLQVLVVELSFASVQARMVQRPLRDIVFLALSASLGDEPVYISNETLVVSE